jgi:hypothetical protein
MTTTRLTRNLFKIASLGIVGLLAGLFSGCNSQPDALSVPPYARISSNWTPPNTTTVHAAESAVEEKLTPQLRHPPSARRLQYGSVRLAHQPDHLLGPNQS